MKLFTIYTYFAIKTKREFIRKEEEQFDIFRENLEKEYNVLTEYASERQQEYDKFIESAMNNNNNNNDGEILENDGLLFDFKMDNLVKIDEEYRELMQGNLKIDNEDVYNFINDDQFQLPPNKKPPIQQNKISHISNVSSLLSQQTNNTDWLEINDPHQIKIKLPINEMGEMPFISKSNHNLPTNNS